VVTSDLDGAEVELDVTDVAAVEQVVAGRGPFDALVCAAGVRGPRKPVWETAAEEWASVLDVNLNGTVAVCRAAVPAMRERGWGRVVIFSSTAGKDGPAFVSPLRRLEGGAPQLHQVAGEGAWDERRSRQCDRARGDRD
jgi:3-oxoacyl-[acyl-carrier protein] reductase